MNCGKYIEQTSDCSSSRSSGATRKRTDYHILSTYVKRSELTDFKISRIKKARRPLLGRILFSTHVLANKTKKNFNTNIFVRILFCHEDYLLKEDLRYLFNYGMADFVF